MTRKDGFRRKVSRMLAISLAGGSLFATSCESRWRQAIVDGGKQLLFTTLFDPNLYIPLLEDAFLPASSDEGTTADASEE